MNKELKVWLRKNIDPQLRDIIYKLNNKGFYTTYCCQGETYWKSRRKRHGIHAYISFSVKLPKNIISKIKQLGLHYEKQSKAFVLEYGSECVIYSEHIVWSGKKLYLANKNFPDKIKKAFDL